jgi:dipeptidyl aminopeptidase/acylaminoacyl peptidase
MRRVAFLILLILLAVSFPSARSRNASTAPGAAKRNLAIDDYFRIEAVTDPQISPEGKWVAYVLTTASLHDDKNSDRIWMIPSADGAAIPLTAKGESSSHPRWSPDGKYLAFLSARGDDAKSQVWLLDRTGGEAQQLTDTIQDVNDFVWSPAADRLVLVLQDPSRDEIEAAQHKDDASWKPKPHPWVIDRLHFKEDEIGYLNRRRQHLYVFSMADHKLTQITSGDYDDSAPAWSPDGHEIAFVSNRSAHPDRNFNDDIWVVDAGNANKGQNLLRITTNPGTDGAPAWSPDGKWLAFTSQFDPKLFQYATFQLGIAPATGGEEKILTRALDRNVSSPHFAPDGKFIDFIADDDGAQNLLSVSVNGGEITRPIPGRLMLDAYSISQNGAIAAQIGTVDRPDEVYILAADGTLHRLTTTNDALMSHIQLGGVDYVRFTSKDGTVAHGYIVKPPNYQPGRRYPTILQPHGGPVWAYYAEFDFQPQLYAANGYVVLLPNPRGSSGYGQDYCKAIYADWGKKDYQDDMAIVDYAVEQGIADPAQLGVGGHSYGAISTNFIIVQTTRFKAAISDAGEFLYATNWGHDQYVREWEIELGLPWDNRALWEKLSPFYRLTNIKTPTLIMGGDADANVPVINGEQMYEGLKWLGVPTLLVVYPGQYHEFTRPSFIYDRWQRNLAWFNHYVRGQGPAIPSHAFAE